MVQQTISDAQLEADAKQLAEDYLGPEIIGSFFVKEKGVMGVAANKEDGCVDIIMYAAPDSDEARAMLRDAQYRIASPARVL